MITKEKLVDALNRVLDDMADGTWERDSEIHPAVAEILAGLPDAPPEDTVSLVERMNPLCGADQRFVGRWVSGHGIAVGAPSRLTIATVDDAPSGALRLTFAELPGYHWDTFQEINTHAVIDPPKSPIVSQESAHPELIDRSDDVWFYYQGYALNDPILCTRAQIEEDWGPVREVRS